MNALRRNAGLVSRRWASSSQAQKVALQQPQKQQQQQQKQDRSDKSRVLDKPEVVYEGAFSSTLRKVKVLSFSTFSLSTVGSPLVVFYTYPEVSVIMKGAIGTAMIFLSASTTAALHWFAAPYVRKLTWKPGSQEFEVETLSMLATPMKRTLHFSDIKPAETQRPLVTFFAKKHYYYVDEDVFPSAELLKKLKKQ